jgi:hypothetical protein
VDSGICGEFGGSEVSGLWFKLGYFLVDFPKQW